MSATKANTNRIRLCHCGKPAARKSPGAIWSCQSCIDKDKIVWEMHERAARRKSEDMIYQ